MHQLVELERLGDEVGGAALDHSDGVTDGAVAGDDDGDDVGVALDRGVDYLRRRPCPGRRRSVTRMSKANSASASTARSPALGLHDHEPVILQALGDGLAQWRLVFDEQQMCCAVRHLRGVSILTPVAQRAVKVNLLTL